MSIHKRSGYQALERWSLFEVMVLKYHWEALALVEGRDRETDLPTSAELREFEEKLDLPDEMYKVLFRELYKIARNAITYEGDERTFKERIGSHPATSNPAKRYFMAIIVAQEMRDDIWQLDGSHFENEDPFTAMGCPLCASCCTCHECSKDCEECREGPELEIRCRTRKHY